MRIKLIVSCILAIAITGIMLTDAVTYATSSTSYKLKFNLDQAVRGTGFFNDHKNIALDQTRLSNLNHGTGNYIYEATFDASAGLSTSETANQTDQVIVMKESVDAVYAPVRFIIGGSMGTVPFDSRIGEMTCAENYGQGASMNAEFLYADRLRKDASADIYWDTSSSNDIWGTTVRSDGRTNLSLASDFTGKAHFGALASMPGTKHPETTGLIDEDYYGTFSLTRKMVMENIVNRTARVDDWLPCCTGGWSTMDLHDRRGHGAGAKGIFDCSCYNVPKAAEFPRPFSK